MDFKDNIHDKSIASIEGWRTENKTWEEIESLSFLLGDDLAFDTKMKLLITIISSKYEYTMDEWCQLVNYLRELESPIINELNKLAEGTKNDAQISKSSHSAWQLYRKRLSSKKWDVESINNIEKSAFQILQMLSQNTEEIEPVKGLVLGNVQSGKTANMAGLIAMAADYGFNYFIVLSGMIDNLREQTEKRLYDDLNSPGNINWQIIKNPHPTKFSTPADQIDRLNLSKDSSGGRRHLSVVLKNSVRLEKLVKYLYSNESKIKQLKILIIDDEADQASINTKRMDITLSEKEKQERTAINNHIMNLVNGYDDKKLKAVNYICYTATPYANVLNESSNYSLYPKDFIISLPTSKNYIGPKQIFGLSEPEQNPSLDIVREITKTDTELLNQIHKEEYFQAPMSLIKAIQWFLMTSVAMKNGGYKRPISMLVHTSHVVSEHERIEEVIKNYLKHIRDVDSDGFLKQCEKLYLTESIDFTKKDFLTGMPEYSISTENVSDYPEWDVIEKGLRALLARDKSEYLTRIKLDEDGAKKYTKGIHLCIDNSKSSGSDDEFVRLVYPDKSNDPGFATTFIVIGGNTLSRGLTLEGLTTSYFMRNTIASDTLMQMGRWFGYRIGYEVYPRIWLNEVVKERFEFVTQLDEELRDDIEGFSRLGKTPKEFGVRVKNSPNNAFIQVTSKNKMQSAIAAELDFEGIQKQTILFKDDYDELNSNIIVTEEFLNSLQTPIVNESRLVWTGVDYQIIKEKFFSKYIASDKDLMFSNLKAFIEWCDTVDNDNLLANWSVVLSSKGNIIENKDENNTWKIHGFNVAKVSRTILGKGQSDGKTISIGALRSPKDLLSDIIELNDDEIKGTKKIEEVRIIREEHGFSDVPQLVIYRIDKDSKPTVINNKKSRRIPLDFSQDIIGISLMIPGMKKGKNVATSLMVHLKPDDSNADLEEEF
ncbi:Z1 domain-containing protein [Trichococcus sp. K1Tr]|uniref:Z1 domain-containing protein n=1 Tax=Trichococcus sp. K1Tr TaxID=3020847 RepID=UPI00232AE033|nr:Z1 domain-containing protein [Trichococcus sp. K1Tr]MDB6352158.1 Z1 domain-containing protein [Trichococcus sp. K1Tr]